MSGLKDSIAKLLAFLKSEQAKKGIGFGLVVLTAYYMKRFLGYLKWRADILRRFPGPKPSLVLGDLSALIEAGGFNETFFENLHGKYGEFARFFLSPTMLNLSVTNPDHVAELYKKTKSRPFETYMFLHYLGKENLLFTHGPMAKQMRLRYGKMISNVDQLHKLNEASHEEFGRLTTRWGSQTEVNVHADLGPVIYDVMGKVMFGGSWSDSAVGRQIYECHLYLIHETNRWMFYPDALKPVLMLLSSDYRKYISTIKTWRAVCYSLIKEREDAMKRDPQRYANDESALPLLINSKNPDGSRFFSKERAISTMCGFLNGAYDTTHATLYWLMFNLAKYPLIQEKVRTEIQGVIGGRISASVDEAREMEYLDCFIRESMRVNVTVPVNQRVNYEEDITIGNYTVPKGTNVNIPMGLVFQDQRFFGKDANLFRPERFLSGEPGSDVCKRSWSAFGQSSRMCIGFTFAMVEMKAVLINILSQYKLAFAQPAQANAEKLSEVGVNQPLNKASFKLTRLSDPQQQYEDNKSWWTPPREKRKALQSTTA